MPCSSPLHLVIWEALDIKPFGIFNLTVTTLDIKTTFSSKQEATTSIMEKNVKEKNPHKVPRSCRDRYTVGCSDEECLFRVNARRGADGLLSLFLSQTEVLKVVLKGQNKQC